MDNIIGLNYNTCFYSSFVFLINVSITLYYGYYLYAGLFFTLFITSLLQHSHYTLLTTILDKIAIFAVVFYGGYIFYNKLTSYILNKTNAQRCKQIILSFLILFTFLSTIVLYYYGYFNHCLCFCDDQIEANWFHSFMHCVGSFGHCCIVFL